MSNTNMWKRGEWYKRLDSRYKTIIDLTMDQDKSRKYLVIPSPEDDEAMLVWLAIFRKLFLRIMYNGFEKRDYRSSLYDNEPRGIAVALTIMYCKGGLRIDEKYASGLRDSKRWRMIDRNSGDKAYSLEEIIGRQRYHIIEKDRGGERVGYFWASVDYLLKERGDLITHKRGKCTLNKDFFKEIKNDVEKLRG